VALVCPAIERVSWLLRDARIAAAPSERHRSVPTRVDAGVILCAPTRARHQSGLVVWYRADRANRHRRNQSAVAGDASHRWSRWSPRRAAASSWRAGRASISGGWRLPSGVPHDPM